ncbi:unnamed protein product [Effrenium voratum]|nr:unnamed protein product [Effrenium voratum]|mmetsp:Transcript_95837/g.228259  ORF Transcript_95837/g.228259 Transcript_95837/m.228259 type:complete len:431 (+) Transcript_95837:123-1415(+)|eukprot:CAMPEP_0181438974 /NCGR_PEP_ID=MMETSP1110-20121109/22189_1 /TAXON_ID=174948 /ORGANISM="Symbiodinium sp., Strain CCMP421" /LENGTH=430 /DNA_ID=CAMNT_0023562685 /DNA_START=123 /DNA_END=1415 /DNA_ORIENTATION=+
MVCIQSVRHRQAFLCSIACLLGVVAGHSNDALVIIPLDKQYVPIHRNEQVVAYKTAYFGQVFVGFPQPQAFSVVFDTGSGHFFLPSSMCQSEACQVHRKYNESVSKSAKLIDHTGQEVGPDTERDEVSVSFGTGEILGSFVEEVICFRESQGEKAGCATARLVTAHQMTEEPFKNFGFDGVMGLGLASLAVDPRFSVFEQMARMNGPRFTPQFGYFISEDDAVPSEICFGGHDVRHMNSALQWAPVHDPHKGFWQVKIIRVSVDGVELPHCSDGSCVAIADTGTSLLGAPRQIAQQLHRLLARKVPETKETNLNCQDVTGPELAFELEGGVRISLGGREYSRAAPMKIVTKQKEEHTVCRASLLPVDPTPALGSSAFILGEPMLRKYYSVYDWEKQRVGFALAKPGVPTGPPVHTVYGMPDAVASSTVHV